MPYLWWGASVSVGRKRSHGNAVQRDKNRMVSREANRFTSRESVTARHLDEARHFECWEAREAYDPVSKKIVETPVIDRSITAAQFLRILPQYPVEGVILKGKQLDKETGKLVEVTDVKITKMSDRTLLKRGKPDTQIDRLEAGLRRQTSRSKNIRPDDDANFERASRLPNSKHVDFAAVWAEPTKPESKRTSGKIGSNTPR